MNKKYDPKFKQEAINLALNSEQTYLQTANDLTASALGIYQIQYYEKS